MTTVNYGTPFPGCTPSVTINEDEETKYFYVDCLYNDQCTVLETDCDKNNICVDEITCDNEINEPNCISLGTVCKNDVCFDNVYDCTREPKKNNNVLLLIGLGIFGLLILSNY